MTQAPPQNSPDAFFVSEECISCGACWRLAPKFIASHAVHTFAYFSRQPLSEDDTKDCRAALELCPVCAIREVRQSETLSVPRSKDES